MKMNNWTTHSRPEESDTKQKRWVGRRWAPQRHAAAAGAATEHGHGGWRDVRSQRKRHGTHTHLQGNEAAGCVGGHRVEAGGGRAARHVLAFAPATDSCLASDHGLATLLRRPYMPATALGARQLGHAATQTGREAGHTPRQPRQPSDPARPFHRAAAGKRGPGKARSG